MAEQVEEDEKNCVYGSLAYDKKELKRLRIRKRSRG